MPSHFIAIIMHTTFVGVLFLLAVAVLPRALAFNVKGGKPSSGFYPSQRHAIKPSDLTQTVWMILDGDANDGSTTLLDDVHQQPSMPTRRSIFQQMSRIVAISSVAAATTGSGGLVSLHGPPIAMAATTAAATRLPLDDLLYRIVRVREATQLESRLIRSGKFKDVQRANIKLAVRFMIENYRLNDAFLAASTYLDSGSNRRLEASQVGQAAVQNLYTILEYFDASDVENLKVGQTSLSGKEETVLKGLDATRRSIDDFLAYFPKSDVEKVVTRVAEENNLNVKEFDPSLGSILNMAPLT